MFFRRECSELLNEHFVTNEEIYNELNGVSPAKVASGLLNLERMLEHLKKNNDEPLEFDSLKLSDDALRKDFGARIRIMRKSLGLTQADLAKKIGTTKQAITTYETGRREPPFKNLIGLSRALHVTTDWLLGEPPTIAT